MKNYFRFMFLVMLCLSLIITACDEKKDDNSSLLSLLLGSDGDNLSAGDMHTYTADGTSFKMAYVPGGITFPTGLDDNGKIYDPPPVTVDPTATVDNAYWIGETEVTYELWYKVYTWAIDAARGAGQYTFTFGANAPRPGNDGTPGSETTSQEPATYVQWRHAMVWCNALTEWYNANNGSGEDLACVYYTDSGFTTPIRAADNSGTIYWDLGNTYSGTEDEPFVNPDANGFRLPTSYEWELAARWRDDATNTVSGYTDPYFTKGNSASDATTYYNDSTDGLGQPGKSANDLVAVYWQYWDGDSWETTGVTSTAIVKSKTTGSNSLGLYDMSGNVFEWCFEWFPAEEGSLRVIRGGCYRMNASWLSVGLWFGDPPNLASDSYGFRISRSE